MLIEWLCSQFKSLLVGVVGLLYDLYDLYTLVEVDVV